MASQHNSHRSNTVEYDRMQNIIDMELLRVPELKILCKAMSLKISGTKPVLQESIRNLITTGDIENKGKAFKYMLDSLKVGKPLPSFERLVWSFQEGLNPDELASKVVYKPMGQSKYSSKVQSDPAPDTIPILHFKESPFYRINKLIPGTASRVLITNGRGSCTIKFKLSISECRDLAVADNKYKLFLYCGMSTPLKTGGNEIIQFPFPNEIRFNNVAIKDNIKGFKSKKGTAKPADLTPYIKDANLINTLEFVYAFTLNEFLLYVYMVQIVPPEELLKSIIQHPKILKAATLYYLRQTQYEEKDDGIITTSTIMSLQCPVSYTRMKYPAKSIMCKHMQCFDALWFLHSQMQIPTWRCPVCQNEVNIKDISICEFVDEILKECEDNVEQVELSTDGSWVPIYEEELSDTSESDKRKADPVEELNTPSKKMHKKDESAIVISLDSDDDNDDSANNVNNNSNQPVVTDTVASEVSSNSLNGVNRQPGDYIDSLIHRTLDPKGTYSRTPIHSEPNTTFSGHHTRNFGGPLGNSPLNSTPTRRNELLDSTSTPDTSILNNDRSISNIASNPFMDRLNIKLPNSRQLSNSSTSTVVINKGMSRNNADEKDGNHHAQASNPFLNSQLLKAAVNNDEASGTGQLHTLTDNALRNNDKSSDTGQLPAFAHSVPVLPPIPSNLSFNSRRTSGGEERIQLPILSDLRGGNDIPHRVTSIGTTSVTTKPIVAPYIPRKNQASTLPQKRQLSELSVTSKSSEDS